VHRALPITVVEFDPVSGRAAQKCSIERISAARPAWHRNSTAAAHRGKHGFSARRYIASGAGNHHPYGVEEMPAGAMPHLSIEGIEAEPIHEVDQPRRGAGCRLQHVNRLGVGHERSPQF
jgi:hypothetical protein